MLMKLNVLVLFVLATCFAPLTMAASDPPDGGLLISRTNGEQWQIRLIAGTQTRRFSGSVESSAPFSSTSNFQLEGDDVVSFSSATTMNAALSVSSGGADGVGFAVAKDARLCLRDSGSLNVPIYVGDDLGNATLVTAPVALSGTDACGDGRTAVSATTIESTTTTLATTSGRKFHPGHYVALLRGDNNLDSQSVMAASIKPGVVGFMKRYTWRELEPTLGSYRFSELQSDLNWASSNGMRLIVMIEDKTFNLEKPTPAYLDPYVVRNLAGGYTVARWSPYVVTRMKALIKALGRFDAHPGLEGIATQETAHGFSDSQMNAWGYTPEKYRDAYIDILTSASYSLPTSRIFWFFNFFPRKQDYIVSVAKATAARGVIAGGPDVLPEEDPLVRLTYPLYDQLQYTLPLFGQVEPRCYAAPHETSGYSTKYWTMPEMFRFARDELHVKYMIWVRLPKSQYYNSYDWWDALPTIQNNPTFNR